MKKLNDSTLEKVSGGYIIEYINSNLHPEDQPMNSFIQSQGEVTLYYEVHHDREDYFRTIGILCPAYIFEDLDSAKAFSNQFGLSTEVIKVRRDY